MMCMVTKPAQKGQKNYFVFRFLWECFNGLIPDGKIIDHINNDRNANRISVQSTKLITQQQNCDKSAKNRDYAFVKYNPNNKNYVKAVNCNTNKVTYYKSMYAVQQRLGINAGIVKMVCEKINTRNAKPVSQKMMDIHINLSALKKRSCQ